MQEFPLVSVLFITYKRVDVLKRSFESFVTNTDYPNLELVVTDDGSPAEVQDEIRKMPFDKMCLSPRNRGLGANTNAGLRACTGKYILQLQDDWECMGPADYLKKSVELMESQPQIGIVKFYGDPRSSESRFRIQGVTEECFWIPNDPGDGSGVKDVYTDTPHLKKRALCDILGAYKEDCRMEECELDYVARFANQALFRAAFFPRFYNRVFFHVGEAMSFRTGSRLRRLEQSLSPYAQSLKRRHVRAYNLTKSVYNASVKTLYSLSIFRH